MQQCCHSSTITELLPRPVGKGLNLIRFSSSTGSAAAVQHAKQQLAVPVLTLAGAAGKLVDNTPNKPVHDARVQQHSNDTRGKPAK